jgi:hypothetical protein
MNDVVAKGKRGGSQADTAEKPAKKPHIARSIFWTHVKRIGFLRTLFGGFLQYLSIFEFIFLHLTVIIVLYRWMLTPFFKVKKFRIADYLLFDRGKIDRMRRFDKLNCQFCAYANGTAKLWNDELDELGRAELGRGKPFRKIIVGLYSICLGIFLVFSFIMSKILFVIIALFLGMHIVKTGEIHRELKASNYAGSHGFALRGLLRLAKVYASSLATNLEQIESSWCPLTHIETETSVVSEHHKNFYDRDHLDEVIEVLATEGSVSPRKPKY